MDPSLVSLLLIKQIKQTYDLATILRCSSVELRDYNDAAKKSVVGLSEEILQSCKAAISLLDSWRIDDDNARPKRARVLVQFSSQDIDRIRDDVREEDGAGRRCVRKVVTDAPYADGHQWRKYGEKSIKGCSFKRNYYRCAYREDRGCLASKLVQQQGHCDPPSYLVTFRGEHTCSASTAADFSDPRPQQRMLQSYQLPKQLQESLISRDHRHPRSCNSDGACSGDNCIPTAASPHTAAAAAAAAACGDATVLDPPPHPESLFSDAELMHLDRLSDRGPMGPEQLPAEVINADSTAGDFAALFDGFFHDLREFGSTDYEAAMMEPLAFEFDELATLF